MSQSRAIARAAAEVAQWERWYHAVSSSYVLATEYLGYDRLTESFHKPIMDEWDERDFSRGLVKAAIREQVGHGVEKGGLPGAALSLIRGGRDYDKGELFMAGRDHYKTTMMIARCFRMYLIWRDVAIGAWHCVEEKIQETCDETAHHFLDSDSVRGLRPDLCPHRNVKTFVSKTGALLKFILPSRKYHRHPSFYAKGAGSEVTGGHPDIGWLDDIIAQKTIDDSEMPKVRTWMGNTLANVIRTDGGFVWVTGTHWSEDDCYSDLRRNPGFDCTIRAARETDGVPDPDGVPVLYSEKQLKRKRSQPGMTGFIWSCQMQNDPLPDESRRWHKEYEQTCTLEEAMVGAGRIFVLSDSAPMGMSLRGEHDKDRGEAGKDYWSIGVFRLRWRGDFQDLIVLDGVHSQEWTAADGFDEACRLMAKWRTRYFFDEDYSGSQLFEDFHKAAKRNGIRFHTEHDSKKRMRLPQYDESYVADAKKRRMQKFCDKGADGEVWVADSCPEEFSRGDGHHTGVFTQYSKWIPGVRRGKSNLKWDDDADVAARCTDRKLQDYMPPKPEHAFALSPWALDSEEDEEDEMSFRSRYCAI